MEQEYKILSAYLLSDFEKQVNEYISNGWTLQGGSFIHNNMFFQSVVFKKNKK